MTHLGDELARILAVTLAEMKSHHHLRFALKRDERVLIAALAGISIERNINFSGAAGRGCGHGRGNGWKPILDQPPPTLAQNDDRELATG